MQAAVMTVKRMMIPIMTAELQVFFTDFPFQRNALLRDPVKSVGIFQTRERRDQDSGSAGAPDSCGFSKRTAGGMQED